MYLGEGVGDFLDTFLEGFLDHRLDEWVELSFHRDFHLGVVVIDGEHLYPDVEGHWRLYGLEFDALGLLALNDAQFEVAHGGHVEGHCVLIVAEIADFVLGDAVAHLLKVAEVTDIVVDCLLRVGYHLDATLEF